MYDFDDDTPFGGVEPESSTRPAKGFASKTPADEPWVWLTRSMLESPAWRAVPLNARRILDALLIAYSRNYKDNGNLAASVKRLADFVGRDTAAVQVQCKILEALGWIKVQRGQFVHGAPGKRSRFTLTWLPVFDKNGRVAQRPTDEWKRNKSLAEAKRIAAQARVSVEGNFKKNKSRQERRLGANAGRLKEPSAKYTRSAAG
jgi:hypothetical protein